MGAQAPALEQRGDAVDARERDVCWLVGRPRHGHAVSEALGGDVRVALPSVGVDEAAGFDGVDDEALEARGIDVWDVPQADAAYLGLVHLDTDDDDRPVDHPAALDAGRFLAQVRLVDLDISELYEGAEGWLPGPVWVNL